MREDVARTSLLNKKNYNYIISMITFDSQIVQMHSPLLLFNPPHVLHRMNFQYTYLN